MWIRVPGFKKSVLTKHGDNSIRNWFGFDVGIKTHHSITLEQCLVHMVWSTLNPITYSSYVDNLQKPIKQMKYLTNGKQTRVIVISTELVCACESTQRVV